MKISIKTICYLLISCSLMFYSCQGEDGEIGPQGEQGLPGQDGQDGQNGENGQDGNDGQDGQNGDDGQDGNDGQDGQNGDDGQDGQDGEDGEDGGTTFFFFEDFQNPEIRPEIVQSEENITNWQRFNLENLIIESSNATSINSSFYYGLQNTDDNSNSTFNIEFNNEIPALVEFDALISSEVNADFLSWSLNGEVINGISGSDSNNFASLAGPFQIQFEVPAGNNILSISYSKNETNAGGVDAALIDNLSILNFTSGRIDEIRLPELPKGVSYLKN